MQTRLSSNMQEAALLWHKSASELWQREQNPFDSKWVRDDCQKHRGTLCYLTEIMADESGWHVTNGVNYEIAIEHAKNKCNIHQKICLHILEQFTALPKTLRGTIWFFTLLRK